MIVTNGGYSWLHESSYRFLPGLVPALANVTLVSARDDWERAFPEDPFAWKRQAFKQIVERRQAQSAVPQELNFVALGDSGAEMEAAHSAAEALEAPALVKTVKLRERPTAAQLLGQLRRVSQELRGVVEDSRDISSELVPMHLPGTVDELDASAYGWRIARGRDWRRSQALLEEPFSRMQT